MASIVSTTKSRATSQAGANTETITGSVTAIYNDVDGNTIAADVRLQGQSYITSRCGNASSLILWKGMSVRLNYPRGAKYRPEIIGAAGAEAGTVLSTSSASSTSAIFGSSNTAINLTGVPMLLAEDDPEVVPDGYTLAPGANVVMEIIEPSDTSGGRLNGLFTITSRPLVTTALPDATATTLPDGTLIDLVDSYGNALGMYRLDATAKVWRRRDANPVGSAGGDLIGTYPDPTVAKIRNVPVSSAGPADGDALVYDATAGNWKPGGVTATVPNASSTTAGQTRLTVNPSGVPVAVGANDPDYLGAVDAAAEVVAAHGSYSTLPDRLDAMDAAIAAGGGGGTTTAPIFGEVASGTVDGTNTMFSFAFSISSMTLWNDRTVYLPSEFTWDGALVTITTPPTSGIIWASYMPTASSTGDTDLDSYLARVAAAGGTLTDDEVAAVAALITGLKADGIWSKLVWIWPGVGDYAASQVALKYRTGESGTVGYNGGINSSRWTQTGSTAGIKGDAAGMYIETGVNILTLDQTSISFGFYMTEDSSSGGTKVTMGSSYTATGDNNRCYAFTTCGFSGQVGLGNAYSGLTGAGFTGTGLMSVALGSGTVYTYKDTTNTASQGESTDWRQTGTFRVLTMGSNYSDARVNFAYIGTYLASAEIGYLEGRLATFKTDTGQV